MREIKFRGKRVKDGKWLYGSLIVLADKSLIAVPTETNNFTTYVSEKVIPETVGQFIGRKDINGMSVDFYEGDIFAAGDSKVPTTIVWHDESHAFYAYNLKRKEYHRLDKFFMRYIGEIIGNIHENPDLLDAERRDEDEIEP